MLTAGGTRDWASALVVRSSEMKRFGAGQISLAVLLLLAGCHQPHGTILGKQPKGDPRTILAVKAGDAPPAVTIKGVMVEKCPVAGCWFRLRDRTGTIKVDTKAAGFVVVNVPLESEVTVMGTVAPEGNEVVIQCTGLQY